MKTSQSQHLWLVIFIALVVPPSTAQDLITSNQCFGISRGKQFTIAFIENLTDRNIASRRLFILVVAFSDQQTEVTISSKHPVAGMPFQETFMIEARGFKRTTIPSAYMLSGTGRSLKAIKVSASSDVSVYGLMYQHFSTDGFLGIPITNLGTQYVVVTFQDRPEASQFAVIGTQDSTTVHVTLRDTVSFEGQTYNQGDVLTIMVNESQVVQIQSTNDLSGSIVQSDKSVAVFSGNECVNIPGSYCDTLIEQLVPINSWGQTHIYTASQNSDTNIYRIIAYFSGTNVTIPGVPNQILDSGEFWEGRLHSSGLVSSNKPTLMVQLLSSVNGGTVDPSLIHIPSEEQFGYVFGFTTPPHSGGDSGGYFNFINIVTKRDARQTVHLNGSPINGTNIRESNVPGTAYSLITLQLPKGEGVYYVEQTDPLASPLSVIVYGYENDESYGYAAGLSLPNNKQLLSFTPYYFREMGGETLTITVPCLETNSIAHQSAMCKFDTGIGDVLVPGDRVDPYIVSCITPTFYKNGLTHVSVSLDDGNTFPYSGIVYVASQEDLGQLLTVKQENWEERGEVIDLTVRDPIILSWDPEIMGKDVTEVDVMIQDSDINNNDFPVLMEDITLMKKVPNTGSVIIPTSVLASHLGNAIKRGKDLSNVAFHIKRVGKAVTSFVSKVYSKITLLIKSSLDSLCTDYTKILSDVPKDVPACPCTLAQANANSDFEISNFWNSFFHKGAENCIRSTTSTPSGSGQQCCYGTDGNILVGPPGGGTADRYSPVDNFWRHQKYDVLPYIACCKLSKNCDKYYKTRPSDDCSDYDPPRPAGGMGDPHVTTLDGKKFTFNGAGEFLMASSKLYNLIFQARMEVYLDTLATVYTAFVIHTNNSAKVQVQMSNINETLVLIDGEPLRLSSSPLKVHYLNGVRVSANDDLSEIRFVFNVGIAVIIYVNSEVMSFIAQLDTRFNGQVKGLLGNLNGEPHDDLQFPNGTIMNSNSSLQKLHEYGLEWLVASEDSIFTYISPYDYTTYYFPEFTPTFDVPDLDVVSQEIKDLCGDSFECLFDAVTTGSLTFANNTRVVLATLDIIQKSSVKIISCGFPGDVENGQMFGHVYLVNSTVEVSCESGYVLEGSSSLTCHEDGRWSTDLPRCESSGKGLTIILAIVISTLIILAAACVAIVICLRKK
ncbi:sushi domain-containing protein 2-like [Anneissia japonica]|uniref:sushi domain-containing protein 2-like n=1 Tax=Anneissia japonica TaxID=1529436 RepID=UPI0014256E26|nr:sushi domain-containing protein 2-like [Anneissia japonica]